MHWVMWTQDADILEKWSPALSRANAVFSFYRGSSVVDMQSDSECADQFSFSIFVVLTLGKEHFLLFFLYSLSLSVGEGCGDGYLFNSDSNHL